MKSDTVYILAGGKGKRLTPHKGLLEIKGVSIINRQIDVLTKLFDDVIIITNTPEFYQSLGPGIVEDAIPGKGPLGGIYSALLNSGSRYNFVVASDMPYLNPSLIKYMLNNSAGYDIIVPAFSGRLEPLHSIYSKGCINVIEDMIKNNNFKVTDLFSQLKVKKIAEEEVARFDPEGLSFVNINTAQDYRLAKAKGKDYGSFA